MVEVICVFCGSTHVDTFEFFNTETKKVENGYHCIDCSMVYSEPKKAEVSKILYSEMVND